MQHRNLRYLLALAAAFLLFKGCAGIALPLRQLTWPTVPARVITAQKVPRHLVTEVRKWSNVSVTGRVRVVIYEYTREGRTYRVRAESHPSAVFASLPATGDTIAVHVDPQVPGRSALWPRPPIAALLWTMLGLALATAAWRLGRAP